MNAATSDTSNRASRRLYLLERKSPRAEVAGFDGDILDGKFVLAGVVENVSSNGFKISNLIKNITTTKHNYPAVVSGNGKHFKLTVMPCWSKKMKNSTLLEVGFKIIQTSWEWAEFVLNTITPSPLNKN